MKPLQKYPLLFIVLLAISILTGCSSEPDPRLERIDRLSEKDPGLARAALDSIDRETLIAPDRHFHNLLDIKIDDKNYVRHTSDSLILDVLDYYSSHKDSPRYPEALYYAGRVYSDKGDYPTALEYFQQALRLVGSNDNEKAKILSQTAEILLRLRLYDRAKIHLSESIDISLANGNGSNLYSDMNMLGFIYNKTGNVDSALMIYEKVLNNVDTAATGQRIEAAVSIASIETQMGNFHKAVPMVRHAIVNSDSISRNFVLANAAYVYLKAGLYDTAYIYSHRLVSSKNPDNRKAGYAIMLSPALRHFLPADSIDYFFNDYKDVLEGFYDRHESQEAIVRQSQYNYDGHVREKEKARGEVSTLMGVLSGCVILILLSASIILYLRNRNRLQGVRLTETLSRLAYFENIASRRNQEKTSDPEIDSQDEKDSDQEEGADSLSAPQHRITDLAGKREQRRQALRERLLSIKCSKEDARLASEPLVLTPVYSRLMNLIESDKPVPDKAALWKEIEKTVLSLSPSFKENVRLLCDNKVSIMEYRILLLMKFCLSPLQIARLISKTKSNVSYYRGTLVRKLFGENDNPIDLDLLIWLL